MTPTGSADSPILLPDPDSIRTAIDVTDERARLLRRLLRLALRFRLHLTTADRLPTPFRLPTPDISGGGGDE